jgi:hypothetical protein
MPPAHHVPQKEHINAQKIAPIHAMYFLFPVSFSSHSSIHPHRIYNLDVKSDVYHLGVVMLDMLSGQRGLDRNRPNGQPLSLVDWVKPYLAVRGPLQIQTSP